MSIAEGQEPPHVPHWIHMSKRESPGVKAMTFCKNFRFGMASTLGRASFMISVAAVNAYLLEDPSYHNKKSSLHPSPYLA